MNNLTTLIYTVAFDQPGGKEHRTMARMLVTGLLRSLFSGRIVIFRNQPEPIFKVARHGVEEIFVEQVGTTRNDRVCFKYEAKEYLNTSGCEVVAFLDADCSVMRNLDHLFPDGPWDILFQPELGRSVASPNFNAYLSDEEMIFLEKRSGSSSGTWAVRVEHYYTVMSEWARLDASPPGREKRANDQPAWNRLLLDTPLRTRAFERDEIQFPSLSGNWQQWREAAILHVPGSSPEMKVEQLAGFFYSRYFSDPSGHFLTLIDP